MLKKAKSNENVETIEKYSKMLKKSLNFAKIEICCKVEKVVKFEKPCEMHFFIP